MPKLLIVEDNTGIRNYLSSLFSNAGFTVDAESDGQVGIDQAVIGGYAAIILDLKMPHVDGLAFLKHMQKHPPEKANGPTIIFSSADYDYAREEALNTGASAFIKKDEYDSNQLVAHVKELIAQHG